MRIRQPVVAILLILALAATWSLAADKPAAPATDAKAAAKPADPAEAKPALPPDGVEAITKPSGDVRLAMVMPGLIAKMLVKEGTPVKAGDVLIQLDDAVQLQELESAQAEAESDTRILAAVATLKQKEVDYKKLQEGGHAVTRLELDHAKLEVEIATRQLELERFVKEQNARKVKELELRIARMKIRSPIDGHVEQSAVKDGEAVDAMAQVIRVVNVDPLWIDVPMPMSRAAALAKALDDGGDTTVHVHFPDADGQWDASSRSAGTVIHVAKVADAASQSRVVRVEVPNPGGRPAGEHVMVSVPR